LNEVKELRTPAAQICKVANWRWGGQGQSILDWSCSISECST